MVNRIAQYMLFLLAFAALAYVWGTYDSHRELAFVFGRQFGDARPIYATRLPVYLDDSATFFRLISAISVAGVGVGLCIVAAARRWRGSICLPLAFAAAVAINASVAHIRDGRDGFVAPFERQGLEYFADVPRVNDLPMLFIRNYAAISPTLSHHAGTHPPGGVLFLWVGTRWFGESVDAAAWWSVVFGALGVIPTYWLARLMLGSCRARRVLPLYLVAPTLVSFGATSMDIVFFVVGVASLAAMVWAMRKLTVTRVLVAGALYWLAAFMTFAVIALPILAGCYALMTAIRRPRKSFRMIGRLALVGLASIFFQALAELFCGYDLLQVADAAMKRDFQGMHVTGYESFRIWRGYSVANLAAFLLGTGLALSAAMIVGAITLPFARPMMLRPAARLALAVPMCLIAISISTLFTLETERVWISVVPAMLCVAASLRGWVIWLLLIALLGVQTFLTECSLYTHW